VFGFLALASAASVPAGAVGWLPVWAAGLPVLLLLTYVAELRAQMRRRHAAGLQRRRGRAVADVRRRRSDFAARLEAVRRALRPVGHHELPVVEPPAEMHDDWQPVAVPLPTYVTAPKAPIRVRTIDVNSDGAWTSAGRVVAGEAEAIPVGDVNADDTAEIPAVGVAEEAAEAISHPGPEPIEEPIEQPVGPRAVND